MIEADNYMNGGIKYDGFKTEFEREYREVIKKDIEGSDDDSILDGKTLVSSLEKLIFTESYATEEGHDYKYAIITYKTERVYYLVLRGENAGKIYKDGTEVAETPDPGTPDPSDPGTPDPSDPNPPDPETPDNSPNVQYFTFAQVTTIPESTDGYVWTDGVNDYYSYLVNNSYLGYEITGLSELGKTNLMDIVNDGALTYPSRYNGQNVVGLKPECFFSDEEKAAFAGITKIIVPGNMKALGARSMNIVGKYYDYEADEPKVTIKLMEGVEYFGEMYLGRRRIL